MTDHDPDQALAMTLYCGWHVDPALAVVAAELVAQMWRRPIAVVPVAGPSDLTMFVCYDMSVGDPGVAPLTICEPAPR